MITPQTPYGRAADAVARSAYPWSIRQLALCGLDKRLEAGRGERTFERLARWFSRHSRKEQL